MTATVKRQQKTQKLLEINLFLFCFKDVQVKFGVFVAELDSKHIHINNYGHLVCTLDIIYVG